MTDLFASIFRPDPDIVAREIAGEMLLVPVRRSVADLQSVYVLNETALIAWQHFDGLHTLAEIRDQITQGYKVSAEQAGQDLLELVTRLEKARAIQRVE